jgi:hypothetical protein
MLHLLTLNDAMDINQQYILLKCLSQERQSISFYIPNTAAIKPALRAGFYL